MDTIPLYDSLMQVALLLEDNDNRLLREFGINRTQYFALGLLDIAHGQRLVDMAAALLCERSTVTRLVDYLEQQGWVKRLADAEDRRSQRVVLTPAGVALREKVTSVYVAALQAQLAILNNTEQRQLTMLLQKLRASLSANLQQTQLATQGKQ